MGKEHRRNEQWRRGCSGAEGWKSWHVLRQTVFNVSQPAICRARNLLELFDVRTYAEKDKIGFPNLESRRHKSAMARDAQATVSMFPESWVSVRSKIGHSVTSGGETAYNRQRLKWGTFQYAHYPKLARCAFGLCVSHSFGEKN
jgi:hypothetical protein